MRAIMRSLLLIAMMASLVESAAAVTTIGSNFDGIMSLIYDPGNGNVFLENAPLPNPAVQRLQVASASGNLIPGNLLLPALTPAVTVTSNSATLLDVSWTSGNFLGTGSFLGNILPAGILQPLMLADLTIDWAPVSSSLVAGDLIYVAPGTTQGSPILPNTGANGFFRFFNVASGQFVDPPTTTGYVYTMESLSSFTKVGLPVGLGNSFTVSSSQGTVSNIAGGAEVVFAGPGVTSFTVTGISPPVDGNMPDAFPVYLEFSTPVANFSMQAIPEPTTLAIFGGVAALATVRGRRPRAPV